MDTSQKKRLWKLLRNCAFLAAAGIGYYIFFKLTHIGIPCIFHERLGFYCPGCGVTRMLFALLELDFKAAAQSNLLILLLSPFLLFFAAKHIYETVKDGKSETGKVEAVFYIVAFVLTIVFVVLRNTERFSFLAPI